MKDDKDKEAKNAKRAAAEEALKDEMSLESAPVAPTAPVAEAAAVVETPTESAAKTPAVATKRGRKGKVGGRKAATPKPVVTPRDKAIRKMLRKAGLATLPALDQLLRGKVGPKYPVKDIAFFIGTPKEEPLKELSKACAARNRTNLSAEVNLEQVVKVGGLILENGRMFQPITVANVDGAVECTSGRHRLAFLALAYGPDVEVPVYAEDMDLNAARDAVVVSNMNRPTKAMERAEHAVLAAVSGNADAKPDELYEKLAKSKMKSRKYSVYSIIERKHPCRLGFPVSLTSSRKDGGVTTVSNVEGYWGSAVKWENGMERKAFDAGLKAATEFLNEMVEAMQKVKEFDPKQHLASMTLTAIGKYFLDYTNVKGEIPASLAGKVARAVIALGEVGRQKSEKTYAALSKAMQK